MTDCNRQRQMRQLVLTASLLIPPKFRTVRYERRRETCLNEINLGLLRFGWQGV